MSYPVVPFGPNCPIPRVVATLRSYLIVILTLAPPPRFLVPRNHPSFMPPQRHHFPSSSDRRRVLVNSLQPSNAAMRVCKNCEKAGRPEKCKIGGSSDRCVECARCGYSCDLAPFSPAKWSRLRRQREQKLQESREVLARFTRLQREVEVLEKKEREMVEGEMENIQELERDEAALSDLNSNDLLFDVSSEQIEFPEGFDWSAFPVGGTPVDVPHSSPQGS